MLGRAHEGRPALAVDHTRIAEHLATKSGSSLSSALRSYGIIKGEINCIAEAMHAFYLALEVAQVAGDENDERETHLCLMRHYLFCGQWEAANAESTKLAGRSYPAKILYQQSEFWRTFAWGQFWRDRLSDEILDQAVEVAKQAKRRFAVRGWSCLRGEWLFAQERLDEAAHEWTTAISMAQQSGVPVAGLRAQLARVLAGAGRQAEARRLVEEALEQASSFTKDHFYCNVAETYMWLGDWEQARKRVRQAYRQAWADGPPHAWWWALRRTRPILAKLGEPEPVLPPFDPSQVAPVPYEEEIRAFIEECRHQSDHTER